MRRIFIDLLPIFIALGFGGAVLIVGGRYPPKKRIGRRRIFEGMIRKRNTNSGFRYRIEQFMERNGVAYHYGRRCGVMQLLVVSLLLMFAGWIVGLQIAVYLGVFAGCIGLLLPWLMIPILNRMDNEKMLPDIRLIYHALAMQIKAGVYVADALSEIYTGVENRRLKDALLDLGGDIVLKSDILTALERFRDRFENRYIDSLCITILQAMESGQAVELLNDIAEQVKDMEKVVLEKKKGTIDRSITFYQLGMLSCVLAVAIYACVSHMFSTTLGF